MFNVYHLVICASIQQNRINILIKDQHLTAYSLCFNKNTLLPIKIGHSIGSLLIS